MDMEADGPAVSCQRAYIDCQDVPRASSSGSLDRKVGEIVTGDFIYSVSDLPSCKFLVPVHKFPVCVTTYDCAEASSKKGEANLKVVEAVDVFEDWWYEGLNIIPYCVR